MTDLASNITAIAGNVASIADQLNDLATQLTQQPDPPEEPPSEDVGPPVLTIPSDVPPWVISKWEKVDHAPCARWLTVPHQTFSGPFDVEVLAYCPYGGCVDSVRISAVGLYCVATLQDDEYRTPHGGRFVARIDPTQLPSGTTIELRATVTGQYGVRCLSGPVERGPSHEWDHGLPFTYRPSKTLPRVVYVSPGGNDRADGSYPFPVRSVAKAIQLLHNRNDSGDAGGGIIRLFGGEHVLGPARMSTTGEYLGEQTTDHEWLTIEPVPGAEAVIVGSVGGGTGVTKTRLRNLTFKVPQGNALTSSPKPGERHAIWFDDCTIIGGLADGLDDDEIQFQLTGPADVWATNIKLRDCTHGFKGSRIAMVRGIEIDNIAANAADNNFFVVDAVVRGINRDGVPTSLHPHVFHVHSPTRPVLNAIYSHVEIDDANALPIMFGTTPEIVASFANINCTKHPTQNAGQIMVRRFTATFHNCNIESGLIGRDDPHQGAASLAYSAADIDWDVTLSNCRFASSSSFNSLPAGMDVSKIKVTQRLDEVAEAAAKESDDDKA